jgi:hypothetical protein
MAVDAHTSTLMLTIRECRRKEGEAWGKAKGQIGAQDAA